MKKLLLSVVALVAVVSAVQLDARCGGCEAPCTKPGKLTVVPEVRTCECPVCPKLVPAEFKQAYLAPCTEKKVVKVKKSCRSGNCGTTRSRTSRSSSRKATTANVQASTDVDAE
ncbi:MAG: hypothetical protein NTX86_00305 [Candidatus Dependentiae bacterium]|nr:hypothetical protein [Candidatus Dependentiae bacterium]